MLLLRRPNTLLRWSIGLSGKLYFSLSYVEGLQMGCGSFHASYIVWNMEYLFVKVCEALCESLVKLAASWFQHGHLFQGGAKLECTCDLFKQALEKCPQKCYQSCSGCWQIWAVLFVWEFITTDPSSRCSWFILQKLQKTLGFPWCIQFMNVHWRFCQTIKWHKCAFSSLPMNASWVKSIVHVLFMPMHLSSVICVWRPNSGLSEIPLKLKQGVGTLSVKCFTLNVVSRLSPALLCPIWWLKLRAQSHQTLSKMLWLH